MSGLAVSVGGFFARQGLRAMLGGVGTKAAAGGKALLGWLGHRTPLELLGFIAIAYGVYQHFGWNHSRHALADCTTARAADATALKNSHANEKLLRDALADQNAKVRQLGLDSQVQQQAATDARKRAAPRIQDAQAVAGRLAASSRLAPRAGPSSAPCEPSEEVKHQWKP